MSQEEEKLYHEEIEVDESNSGENLISEDKPGDLGETNTEVTDAKDTDAKVTDAADEAEEAEEAGEAGEVSVANGDHNDNNDDNDDDDDDDDFSDLSDIDENELPAAYLADKELLKLSRHKRKTDDSREDETNSDRINEDQSRAKEKKRAKNRRTDVEEEFKDSAPLIENEDELTKKRRLLEEKMDMALKNKTVKRRKGEDDIDSMQDEAISRLRDAMREAAYKDADCVNNGQPAINKLSLLSTVRDVLLRANLADSILDNNLLESVRLWLEPLPDASLPAYEIQRTLIEALPQLPIKTIHLRESGLGKVMIFYQKSKRVEPNLKRICEKLIGDWTRAIMGRSDNYRDKSIKQVDYSYFKHKADIPTQARTQQIVNANKSLYEESAARRNRAAAPAARTTAYKVAPRANLAGINSRNKRTLPSGVGTALNKDERFKSLSQRLHSMGIKKKGAKKGGVSIEGKGISM